MDVVALAAAGIEEVRRADGHRADRAQIELLWRLVRNADPVLRWRRRRPARGDARDARARCRCCARRTAWRSCACPPGWIPTIWSGAHGSAAMLEHCSGGAQPWSTRCGSTSAKPRRSTTPEDKAGLKARLLAHVETIGRSRHPRALSPRTARSVLGLRLSPTRAVRAAAAGAQRTPRVRRQARPANTARAAPGRQRRRDATACSPR